MFSYILSDTTATIFTTNASCKVKTFSANDKEWTQIIEGIKTKNEQALIAIMDRPVRIKDYTTGHIELRNGLIYYKNEVLHEAICRRLIRMYDEGFDISHLLIFLNNLMENPSNSAKQELYEFLAACNLPITTDGHFLAYKLVRDNFMDVHSGTMDNTPGAIVKMARNNVDDRRNITCSHGLHVCSLAYLRHFYGDRLVLVKVNPRDVVSVPEDYGNTKMRVCQYEVIKELDKNTIQEFNEGLQPVEDYNTRNLLPVEDSSNNDLDEDEDLDVNTIFDIEDEDETE